MSSHLNVSLFQYLLFMIAAFLAVYPLPPSLAQSSDDGNFPACSASDRAALLRFKSGIIRDTTGILSSWVGTDCCGAWEGVECHPKTGRITALQLQSPPTSSSDDNADGAPPFMKGILSPALGDLPFLEVLVISGMKQIMGPIPLSLSNLTALTQLYLENNMLQGAIPAQIGGLKSLKAMSLSGNRLAGQIPASFGGLVRLQQINLGKNALSGPVPAALRNLAGSLQSIDFSYNLMTGNVPQFLSGFKNLTFLDLSHNQFSGPIPASLCTLSNALDISLSHNRLVEGIPNQIGGLKSLNTLSLSNNLLTGTIPESLTTLQKLWYLNLSSNAITNPLPTSFSKSSSLPSLLSIDLSYNNLHLGDIPNWVKTRELREVHLAGCNIRGTISTLQMQASMLTSLDLSDNLLTGDIARFLSITDTTQLQKLKLSNNQFDSDISTLTLPDTLSSIDLHGNFLTGSPSTILVNATRFLEHVGISSNRLTGALPQFFRLGSGLKWLDLSRNMLTGQIPPLVSNLGKLERLDLSVNRIGGGIPDGLGKLERLKWLDLSGNGLTGKIPDSLLGLNGLRHANFRSNLLCGLIPQGRPFNVFRDSAYAHNRCLCGKPLPPCVGTRDQGDLV